MRADVMSRHVIGGDSGPQNAPWSSQIRIFPPWKFGAENSERRDGFRAWGSTPRPARGLARLKEARCPLRITQQPQGIESCHGSEVCCRGPSRLRSGPPRVAAVWPARQGPARRRPAPLKRARRRLAGPWRAGQPARNVR